ncbi:MAG: hypothetical protein AAFU79_12690 [Myxococcota bacterium]
MGRRWTVLLLLGSWSCLESPARRADEARDAGAAPPFQVTTSSATVAPDPEETDPSGADPSGAGLSRGRTGPSSERAPRWVREDVTAPGVIFGVGSVRGVANRGLARITAENRARANLMRKLGVGEREAVSGIDIVDHWTDPRSGAMFARARFFVGPHAE